VLGRTIRVDHVQEYKIPKDSDKLDDVTRKLQQEGCAPIPQIPEEYIKKERPPPASTASAAPPNIKSERQTFQQSMTDDIKLPMRLPIVRNIKQESQDVKLKKPKKEKKSKKEKKKRKRYSSSSDSSSDSDASRKRRRR
jgi:RNA-binding motif protein, X-linked 2